MLSKKLFKFNAAVKFVAILFLFYSLIGVASASVTYSAAYPRIVVTGDDTTYNMQTLYDELVNQYGVNTTQNDILNETSPKVWEMKVWFYVTDNFIIDDDVTELRLGNSYSGIAMHAPNIEIHNTTISSWNMTSNDYRTEYDGFSVWLSGNVTNVSFYAPGSVYWGFIRNLNINSVENKRFENVSIEKMKEGLHVLYADNVQIHNIDIRDGHPIFGNGFRAGQMNNSVVSNINIINVSNKLTPATAAYGVQITGYNNILHDVYIDGCAWSGTNIGGYNWSISNVTVLNSGHNGFEMQASDSTVDNVTVEDSTDHNFFTSASSTGAYNVTYTNIVSNVPKGGSTLRFAEDTSNIIIYNPIFTQAGVLISESENVTIINMTQSGGNAGYTSTYTVAGYTFNRNHKIIDSILFNNAYKDIWITKGTNISIINTNYSTSKVDAYLATSYFTNNYYVDIKVVDGVGSAIEGATITLTNTTYPAKNGWGNAQSLFTTLATGYTPLPNSNRGESPVITYLYTNVTDTVYPIYDVSVSASGYDSNIIETITPDSSWYRADPNVPTYTITAIIPEINAAPDITGFAPAEDNAFNTGDSKIFRVWTDESLTSMNWYLDGSLVSSNSMDYTWVTTEGGHTIIFEGSNTNGAVTQRWDINGGISGVVLAITESFPVDTAPDQNNGSTYEFNVTVNQPLTSSSWYLDGNSIASDTLSLDHTWIHASTHNITFVGSNANGSISETWVVNVNDGSLSSVAINPATQTIAPNQPFALTIPITPETPIAGAQFDLNFDNSLATVTSVTEGNLLDQDGATTLFNSGTINNAAGTVTNIYGSILGATSVSSQGSFATISMTAGSTTGYLNLNLANIIISDADSAAVPYTLTNATILVDTAPVLDNIGAKSVDEDNALTFTTSASDVDGDSLTYTATNLPTGASFNTATGAFSWTPADGQAGTYVVTFEVTDGYISDSEAVTITVNDGNNAPVITTFVPANSLTFNESDVVTVGIIATDADGQALSYTIKIDGVTKSTSSSYVWETDYSSAGTHTIDITVSDGIEQVTDSRTITINDVQPRWDVNEDGTVNVLDISIIGQKYGSSVEAPYPRWDVNQDGAINVQDMTLTGSHFGETVA